MATLKDKESQDSWRSFVIPADEWLVNYSVISTVGFMPILSVALFSIGQAVELYLKASMAKITGNSSAAIKYGHNIAKLLEDCQGIDPKCSG